MKQGVLRKLVVGAVMIGLLSVTVVAFAEHQVSAARHPNLAAAQELVQNAINKLAAAQRANDFDMKGHAAKAKELLDQAYEEIWQAAQAANAQ